MFKRYIKIIFVILFCNICIITADDFSEGPYGTNYFDIAAPFSIPDLNAAFQGDANIDGIIMVGTRAFCKIGSLLCGRLYWSIIPFQCMDLFILYLQSQVWVF